MSEFRSVMEASRERMVSVDPGAYPRFIAHARKRKKERWAIFSSLAVAAVLVFLSGRVVLPHAPAGAHAALSALPGGARAFEAAGIPADFLPRIAFPSIGTGGTLMVLGVAALIAVCIAVGFGVILSTLIREHELPGVR